MNQEVANFVVEFTSKGLAELKEGLVIFRPLFKICTMI